MSSPAEPVDCDHATPLELDHIFCMVDDLDQVSRSLERSGWVLDAGTVHEGQGTRNRCMSWPEQHLELLCVVDHREAGASPLRLDRRGDWASSGASPFGFGFRGVLADDSRRDYWLYQEHGTRIWMHRDNERAAARPLVFVLDTSDEEMEQHRPRSRHPDLLRHRQADALLEVHVTGPSPASLPPYVGPPITQASGPHHLRVVAGPKRRPQPITPILTIQS